MRFRQLWPVALFAALLFFAAGCARGPSGPTTSAFDGTYQGTAYNIGDPGGGCVLRTPTSVMTVSQGYVQFGQYSGTVSPSGYVQMLHGWFSVSGQFGGGKFQGEVRYPQPGCLYRLDMPRIA
ncbi:hypothetical protein [Limobrevibacterium gyesilva]|nr:hypothetical protein [Limobrevibacterium gyesilva]